MQIEHEKQMIKIYPIMEWCIGGVVLIFMVFCAVMAARAKQYAPSLGFLLFTLLPIWILLAGSILSINEHIIVMRSPLIRRQIGWDEIEKIEIIRQTAIVLIGQSTTGIYKRLMIPGQGWWLGNKKKQIRKIFAQQIKLRQIQVFDANAVSWYAPSSKSTTVSLTSDAPEEYIAAAPRYRSSPLSNTYNNENKPNDQPNAVDYRSGYKVPLENKLNVPSTDSQPKGNLFLGGVAGFFVAVICSLIWAVIVLFTHREFSIVSVGLGILVGGATRFVSGKGNLSTAIVSGVLALIGCMIGNTLGAIMIFCQGHPERIVDVAFTLLMKPTLLFDVYRESSSMIDILFYLGSIYGAFRMAVIR